MPWALINIHHYFEMKTKMKWCQTYENALWKVTNYCYAEHSAWSFTGSEGPFQFTWLPTLVNSESKLHWLINPESKSCFYVKWNTVGTLSIKLICIPDFWLIIDLVLSPAPTFTFWPRNWASILSISFFIYNMAINICGPYGYFED